LKQGTSKIVRVVRNVREKKHAQTKTPPDDLTTIYTKNFMREIVSTPFFESVKNYWTITDNRTKKLSGCYYYYYYYYSYIYRRTIARTMSVMGYRLSVGAPAHALPPLDQMA
jgi:hypothetical protein